MIYKNSLKTLLALACSSSLQAADDFVRQTDLETNVTMDTYVAGPDGVGETDGNIAGAMPVGPKGARFQLFGVGLAPDTTLYTLDETVTGIHTPTGSVETSSTDPYAPVTRTRADIPFQAQLSFSDFQTTDDAPLSSKYLYVERLVVEYPEGDDRLPATNDGNESLRVVEAFFVNNNGTTGWTDIETSLKSEFEHKQKGEERIRIYALPNEDLTWYILEEKKIHVWPIADAELKASTTGSVDDAISLDGETLSSAPTLFIKAEDLYPSSKTYVRIYKGGVSDLAAGAEDLLVITAKEYVVDEFHTVTPQSIDTLINSSKLDEFTKEGGTFTAEIVTETPFNTAYERLAWATFDITASLKVRAGLTSAGE